MTQPNIEKEHESAHAVRGNNNSESKASDIQVAGQPSSEKSRFFENYCDSNPGAAQCRVYDV